MEIVKARDLQESILEAAERVGLVSLEADLDELRLKSQRPDFWQDNLLAQATMKQIAKLEARITPWRRLLDGIHETVDLLSLEDDSMSAELTSQLDSIEKEFNALKEQLKLNGPFDDHDAILSVYAGAGGTDAQDWAQMVQRMYTRFAEKSGWQTTLLEESSGEEAGIKSVTIELSGPFAYGKLKGEHGVHRLVRLSPFNAESRETSFAKVEVLPKIDKPEDVEIDEKDLRIDVFRSGGHGGQSVNTTDSAVRVTHTPTNIVVVIQNERSQLQNKETALTILRSKLAQLKLEQHAEKISELKGPDTANEFGSQIRNYVLHPYKQVKDLRTNYETSDPDAILDGNLEPLIDAYLEFAIGD